MTATDSREISVAVVGTGPNSADSDAPSMAYHHGNAYAGLDECRLVACADLVAENAAAFASEFGIDPEQAFTDHTELLASVEPDLVSVCVPPSVHADIVTSCAERGVGAIHCEKPMALTWEGARRMAAVCRENDVQLTFNHQRRFGTQWQRANELLREGAIGQLQRVEMAAPNLFDWGTHCFDLCGMYAGEPAADWVLGQIDYSTENVVYGAHQENRAVAAWEYENGVTGMALTGEATSVSGSYHQLVGTTGQIEVRSHDEPAVRYWNGDTDGWEVVECERSSFVETVERAISSVIESYISEERPNLCAENALKSTELIFGTWESARSRGLVRFPLRISDNPLEAMVESGELAPQ